MKKLETIETEMLELRLINTKKSIEQELERDDIDGLSTTSATQLNNSNNMPNGSNNNLLLTMSEAQFERLKRENENLKRQIKQEKENTNTLIQNERKFFETKLKEKDEELLEIEKQSAIHKRKHQKLGEEMQDLQRMCEESKVRNRELEKLQLKFDADMAVWRNKYEGEKEIREKCERERETIKYEIFSLKSELESQKLESNYHAEKNDRLERDLKEYENATSNTSNLNINGLNSFSNQLFFSFFGLSSIGIVPSPPRSPSCSDSEPCISLSSIPWLSSLSTSESQSETASSTKSLSFR